MTPDQINQLTDIVLKAAFALIPLATGYVIFLARTALNQLVTSKTLRADIDTWVKAAAQTIPDKSQRYSFVARAAAQAYPGVGSDKIDALIEAGVAGFKTQLGTFNEATAPVAPALPALDPATLTQLAGQLASILAPKVFTPTVTTNAASTAGFSTPAPYAATAGLVSVVPASTESAPAPAPVSAQEPVFGETAPAQDTPAS